MKAEGSEPDVSFDGGYYKSLRRAITIRAITIKAVLIDPKYYVVYRQWLIFLIGA